MARDWADEKASAMFPCNCKPFKDGSHWHDCQSLYADEVAAALRAVDTEARKQEHEACAAFALDPINSCNLAPESTKEDELYCDGWNHAMQHFAAVLRVSHP